MGSVRGLEEEEEEEGAKERGVEKVGNDVFVLKKGRIRRGIEV